MQIAPGLILQSSGEPSEAKADECHGLLRYVRDVTTRNERVLTTDGTSASKIRTDRCAPRDPRCTARFRAGASGGLTPPEPSAPKSFQRKPDAQAYLNGLTADVQRGEYVDPRKSAETFGSVSEQWCTTN